jgi:nitrogen fixation protein NifU and related proteins
MQSAIVIRRAASTAEPPFRVFSPVVPLMTDELYDEHILDHYESPYHRGHLEHPTIAHEDENPLCGDQVRLELLIDEGNRVREAWFSGHGCAISQAAASILTKEIEGKSLEELRNLQAPQMLDLIKVRLTASRQKCGLLSFKILKTMLYSLEEQTPPTAQGTSPGTP